jgi:hypothetical protein
VTGAGAAIVIVDEAAPWSAPSAARVSGRGSSGRASWAASSLAPESRAGAGAEPHPARLLALQSHRADLLAGGRPVAWEEKAPAE